MGIRLKKATRNDYSNIYQVYIDELERFMITDRPTDNCQLMSAFGIGFWLKSASFEQIELLFSTLSVKLSTRLLLLDLNDATYIKKFVERYAKNIKLNTEYVSSNGSKMRIIIIDVRL